MDMAPPPAPRAMFTPGLAPNRSDAARAAHEFEVGFLSQAVEEMMRGTTAGEFGGGHAEETWRSFLARAFAEQIAAHGSIGIARSIEGGIAAYGAGKAGK